MYILLKLIFQYFRFLWPSISPLIRVFIIRLVNRSEFQILEHRFRILMWFDYYGNF